MRDLDIYQSDAVDRNVTAPRYLVRLHLEDPMHLSTRDTLVYAGAVWVQSDIRIGRVSELTATLSVRNTDWIFSANAFRGEYTYRPVEILFAYPYIEAPPPYFPEGYLDFPIEEYVQSPDMVDIITLFAGHISDINSIGDWLEVTAVRTEEKRYPSVKIRPPLANHLPAPGQIITWKGQTYRIDA